FELARAGYDVTVLEARNRIGGRVVTFADMVPGKKVEGGGELIGSNHPMWMTYAKRLGLDFLDFSDEEGLEAPIQLGGQRLAAKDAEALWEELDRVVSAMNADAALI